VGVGLIVVAVSAHLIAYWQRKGNRQIELYRRDPSVGLSPPPSPLWKFVKTNWEYFVLLGVAAFKLLSELFKTGPITRSDVFQIAFFIGLIFFVIGARISLWLVTSSVNGIVSGLSGLTSSIEKIDLKKMPPSD
jgi:hypothetical protein